MYRNFRPFRLQPPCTPKTPLYGKIWPSLHVTLQRVWLPFAAASGLGFAFCQQARRHARPNRVRLCCGLVVHLLLLSTSPRGDAVTFGYGPENVCPGRTCTVLFWYTLKRTGTGFQPVPAG